MGTSEVADAIIEKLKVTARAPRKAPLRVAVTGAAGQIGYAPPVPHRGGRVLGPDQPVILQLLEIPHAVRRR